MAKLGRSLARWSHRGSEHLTEYTIREDSTILRKVTFLKEDGSVDFSDGWKVARNTARIASTVDALGTALCKQGFQRVYR